MEISSKVRYALLALLELAKYYEQGEVLQIEHIAAVQQIPERYLGQLMMMLRRSGLVRSQRGAKGGYFLSKAPEKITLLAVLACMEGLNIQQRSHSADSQTMENTIVQEIGRETTATAMAVFGSYTLQDLYDRRLEMQRSHLDVLHLGSGEKTIQNTL